MVFADLNTAEEGDEGAGLHAEALFAANFTQNVAAPDRTQSHSARRAISSWPDRRDSLRRLRCGRS